MDTSITVGLLWLSATSLSPQVAEQYQQETNVSYPTTTASYRPLDGKWSMPDNGSTIAVIPKDVYDYNTILNFARKLAENTSDIDPEIQQVISEDLWGLL